MTVRHLLGEDTRVDAAGAPWRPATLTPRPRVRWPGTPRTLPVGPRPDPRSVGSLARLGRLVTLLRWASVAVAVALLPGADAPSRLLTAVTGVVLVAAALRTWRPLRLHPTWRSEAWLLLDLALAVGAIIVTGGFTSPFLLTPLAPILAAAYAWGYREGIAAAILALGAVGLSDAIAGAAPDTLRIGALVTVVILAAAGVGGFTHQVWTAAERSRQATLDHATRLRIANDLLHTLHDVVQTLPASLDLRDVLTSARRRLRELFGAEVTVVLVPDELVDGWRVEVSDGVRLPRRLADGELPAIVAQATRAHGPVVAAGPEAPGGAFHPESGSVAAVALAAQDRTVGILVLEHPAPGHFAPEDLQLLRDVAATLALAVDNARWFAKLYTLGAETERARIARDLHDRIAQSLAAVGFGLERLAARGGEDTEAIRELHSVLRSVVADLRDTLYELRTAVDDDEPLHAVASRYVARWEHRTGLRGHVSADTDGLRLPVQVEQELCRILQEALTNIERHARATAAWVTWRIDGRRAVLEIRDDGSGFDPGRLGPDCYGLRGMRERADAIGAVFAVDAGPGRGTRLRVELEVTT